LKITDTQRLRRMTAVFFLGFSSGLPLLLIGATLKAWLADKNVDLALIGAFAIVQLPYAFKFVWSPILDRFTLPFLDRRRGWILFFQLSLAALLAGVAAVQPDLNPALIGALALLVAFASASQDIAIDAYRREVLLDEELGLGSTLAVNGYRVGMLVAGAGVLLIADQVNWHVAYLVMAGLMVVSAGVTIFSPPISKPAAAPKDLWQAAYLPIVEYFQRRGAIEMLVFVLLFKIGDQMASDMLNPFYLDIGFTKTEIGTVSKFFGFWATIAGGFAGGFLIFRWGIVKSLWIFGILQALSTGFFAVLASMGPKIPILAGVVAFENLASGMGTAAYVAFMAGLCDRRFTATQYALLSSLIGVPRAIFGSASGVLAQSFGWTAYFVFCAVIAIPGLLMLFRAGSWQSAESADPA
jgi:MFS transporter, PAT family, beta-lactamase induction signal transducer AmpG